MSGESTRDRAARLFLMARRRVFEETDRLFLYLLLVQWVVAIGIAVFVSPAAWAGKIHTLGYHLPVAFVFGGLINLLPIWLILTRPGETVTRVVVTIAQMMWSALLVQLTGGRIETHFHVFVSIAFLAFYRDWRLLPLAAAVATGGHFVRGLVWPESIYGVLHPEWWRFLEDGAWIAFEDLLLIVGCTRAVRDMRAMAEREAQLAGTQAIVEREVATKTSELRSAVDRYRMLVENTNAVPWEMDAATYQLTYISPQASRLFGCDARMLIGSALFEFVHQDDRERVEQELTDLASSSFVSDLDLDYRIVSAQGLVSTVRNVVSVRRAPSDGTVSLVGIMLDVTRQTKLEVELRQAQKLESVGRLAAGVAHEINTPVQFVSDSVHFVQDALRDMTRLIAEYRVMRERLRAGQTPDDGGESLRRLEEEYDVDYILDNAPKALDRSLEGLGRVSAIVRSMKEFAHPDRKDMTAVDLNHAIQSTLTIARNEYKYVADLETDFGELPPVTCHAGEINQVVLNVVVNAAHAIEEVVKATGVKGRISVATRQDGDDVIVSIADTGGGIPPEIRERIFDPFFTTKSVGRGTGQGLAIARAVVVEKHGGALTFESEVGKGTTFFIRLPIRGRAVGVAA